MKKELIERAIIGMGYGFPITLLCMTLIGGYNGVIRELLVWMIASALYGILSAAMFSGELEWPLPALLGVHCVGCLAITIAAAAINGYVTDAASALPVLLPFAVIYAAVYGVCVWLMKRSEKQINEALKDK